MIDFKPITLDYKQIYEQYLQNGEEHGCEYSFANLFLWGRQQAALLHDHIVLFSQYNRRTVYPFPVGSGDKKTVLDAIIADSKERGIPCRITSLIPEAEQLLEELYPDMFIFHSDRDFFDYVYDIDNLAALKGSKYHKKRNHYNRFRDTFPEYTIQPIREDNIPQVKEMVNQWYEKKLEDNPDADFTMEQIAIEKALKHFKELGMDGIILLNGETILAMTMGSHLSPDTMDIHFEKARWDADGAYAAINCEFAKYLRDKYPELRFLNREDDMGLEGLRKAKERYYPHHMVEKSWAHLREDGYEY